MPKLGPGLGKPTAHLMAQRIQSLRSVHPDDEDLSQTLGLDDGHLLVPSTIGDAAVVGG